MAETDDAVLRRWVDRTCVAVPLLAVVAGAWCARRSVALEEPWLVAASCAAMVYAGVASWLCWREL